MNNLDLDLLRRIVRYFELGEGGTATLEEIESINGHTRDANARVYNACSGTARRVDTSETGLDAPEHASSPSLTSDAWLTAREKQSAKDVAVVEGHADVEDEQEDEEERDDRGSDSPSGSSASAPAPLADLSKDDLVSILGSFCGKLPLLGMGQVRKEQLASLCAEFRLGSGRVQRATQAQADYINSEIRAASGKLRVAYKAFLRSAPVQPRSVSFGSGGLVIGASPGEAEGQTRVPDGARAAGDSVTMQDESASFTDHASSARLHARDSASSLPGFPLSNTASSAGSGSSPAQLTDLTKKELDAMLKMHCKGNIICTRRLPKEVLVGWCAGFGLDTTTPRAAEKSDRAAINKEVRDRKRRELGRCMAGRALGQSEPAARGGGGGRLDEKGADEDSDEEDEDRTERTLLTGLPKRELATKLRDHCAGMKVLKNVTHLKRRQLERACAAFGMDTGELRPAEQRDVDSINAKVQAVGSVLRLRKIARRRALSRDPSASSSSAGSTSSDEEEDSDTDMGGASSGQPESASFSTSKSSGRGRVVTTSSAVSWVKADQRALAPGRRHVAEDGDSGARGRESHTSHPFSSGALPPVPKKRKRDASGAPDGGGGGESSAHRSSPRPRTH